MAGERKTFHKATKCRQSCALNKSPSIIGCDGKKWVWKTEPAARLRFTGVLPDFTITARTISIAWIEVSRLRPRWDRRFHFTLVGFVDMLSLSFCPPLKL